MAISSADPLCIHIERHGDGHHKTGLVSFILPITTQRFGVSVILLFLILLASESYYLNKYSADDESYVGGLFSVIGLYILIRALIVANASWKRYVRSIVSQPKRPYVTITPDYIEEGMKGLWHTRYRWSMLKSVRERSARFVLDMSLIRLVIEKSDICSDEMLTQIRALLAEKQTEYGSR